MTNEELKNMPYIIDTLLDDAITDSTRQKVKDTLTEVCKLAIKALEQQPQTIVMTKEEFERYLANEDLVVVKRKFLNEALEAQPSEDCISRQVVIKNIKGWFDKIELNPDILIDSIVTLPSVTPRRDLAETSQDCISREEINEFINVQLTDNEEWASSATNEGRWVEEKKYLYGVEILEGLSEYVNDLPSVKPQYTDEEIDNAQAVEQAYVDKMVELAVEEAKRPKGKWIYKNDNIAIPTGYYQCSECGEGKLLVKDNFCPNCGAEMGGADETN